VAEFVLDPFGKDSGVKDSVINDSAKESAEPNQFDSCRVLFFTVIAEFDACLNATHGVSCPTVHYG
jgi:hypothetical protein